MEISKWLEAATKQLRQSGVDSARLDTLCLLEHVLQKDRSWLLAHLEFSAKGPTLSKLNSVLKRRIDREPLAYILGKKEFYGREFDVNSDVLIPRPESEAIIDILKNLLYDKTLVSKVRPWKLVDVGTGSGCLAISLALEIPGCEVIATDISEKALTVARKNAQKLGADIKFLKGDLLEPISLTTNYDVRTTIMANLPYVPDGHVTSTEITKEPSLALFSGADGLDLYRRFWDQVSNLPTQPKYIITESLESQHKDLEKMAKKEGFKLIKTKILIQLFEVL